MLEKKKLFVLGFIVLLGLIFIAVVNNNKITSVGDYSWFELRALHELWGGYNIIVRSDGTIRVEYKEISKPKEITEGKLTGADMLELVQSFVENDFSKMKDVDPMGLLDESVVNITIIDPIGKPMTVSQPFNERTDEFNIIYEKFIKFGEKIRNTNSPTQKSNTQESSQPLR